VRTSQIPLPSLAVQQEAYNNIISKKELQEATPKRETNGGTIHSEKSNAMVSMLKYLSAVVPTDAADAAVDSLLSSIFTDGPRDEGAISATCSTTLAAAKIKAALLAATEEHEAEKCAHKVIQLQVRKMELKMGQLKKFEEMLTNEKEKLETARKQLRADRLHFETSKYK